MVIGGISIKIFPESKEFLEPILEKIIGLFAASTDLIIMRGAIILGIGAVAISLVFPFAIIYAIYYAIKSLIKYNHDLNHQEQHQHKNLWED